MIVFNHMYFVWEKGVQFILLRVYIKADKTNKSMNKLLFAFSDQPDVDGDKGNGHC